MRKILLLFAVACCMLTAQAKTIERNGIYYEDRSLGMGLLTVVSHKVNGVNYPDLKGAVVIPASFEYEGELQLVWEMEDNAFKGANGITSVTFEHGSCPLGIGDFAFCRCSKLKKITFPRLYADEGMSQTLPRGVCSNCAALKEVILPENVEIIGGSAFYMCPALQTINLPNTLVQIGYGAFCGCYSLQSITIPGSVGWVEEGAFEGCPSLEKIILEDGVASIGERAFKGCTKLKWIYNYSAAPLWIPDNTFEDVVGLSHIKLIVPNQSVNSYRAADVWKKFYVKKLDYDISFKVNGSIVYTISKKFDTPASDIKAEAEAVRQQMSVPAGKVFKRWNPEITSVEQDQVYEAVLESTTTVSKCSIKFALDGVFQTSFQLDEGSPKSDVEYLAEIFLDQVYIPMDREFKYWEPALAAVTDNQTYNAVTDYIDQNYYTISFVVNGETVFSVDLKYGTEDWVVEGYANCAAESAVYPEGMTFDDWDKYFDKVTGPETYTARLRPIGEDIEEVSQEPKANSQKMIKDGQLIIERNGKTYNALGAEIK